MPRMLVSGGNGFLGYYLVEKALKEGFSVVVVDDLSTSKEIQLPKEVTFVKQDVESYQTDEKFDFVIHLAARPSPEDYMNHPVTTLTSNSIGTLKMLEIARKSNAIFLYTSSSEVYGNASIIPTSEDYFGNVNPNGVRSCYDEGKRFSEALIMAYHRQYGVDTRIIRPFNVYGPRIRADSQYGRVVPRFATQALAGKPLTLTGDGSQTRAFLYIDDWVDAVWTLLSSKQAKGSVLNIGSGKETTVLELANIIKRLTGSNSAIEYIAAREEDPQRRAADITKAKALLNWEPKVGLEEGLVRTIKWFQKN
ncbi:MAG: NAD-dependent epimerase/dehydratase family protein [Candidatus Micrarchaeota archaeon]|nr:NAD-dependent epimerase/dehydratase family protein [Candidatus Micrarchaeota archaeon]